jgi:hypothetical protein
MYHARIEMKSTTMRVMALLLFALNSGAHAAQIACPVGSNPACLTGFPVGFSGGTIPSDVGYVLYSSPGVARLGLVNDTYKDIVVGTTTGYVVAYHADGSFLWAYKTGNIPVYTKPAIADIDGDGVPEIVVGAGTGGVVGGGVYVLRNNGTLKCAFTALDPTYSGWGIYSSPALAHLDRTRPNEMQAVFGGFDMHIRAMRPDCSLYWDKGRSDFVVDTVWSSPAVYDLDHDGQLDVIIGEDSEPVTINGTQLPAGGLVRAFRGNGVGELPGFPIMLNEVVYSSPAIGDLNANGQPAIVVGNGRCWDLASCATPHAVTEATFAWGANAAPMPGWPYPMPSQSTRTASPALADLDGDGKLETVINTLIKTGTPSTNDVNGYVHVIRSNGAAYPGWPVQPNLAATCSTDVHYGSMTSPIVVDLDGDGHLEILNAVGPEVMVWDRNGNQVSRTHTDACANPNPAVLALRVEAGAFSTPTAADLFGDGHIEVVVGSAVPGSNPAIGALYAWRFQNSVATAKNMPWPEFRHDALNTGVYVGDSIFKNGFD